ncbi:hypothetical protein [Bacillus taeanensis]|nr:hypothetical protein [Bacillus taeanensis]
MKELVGCCVSCGKEIYCQNGFLNGVIRDDQLLQCFPCYNQNVEGA